MKFCNGAQQFGDQSKLIFDFLYLQIACGLDHTLLLSTDGKVFSCGWGADGQTGKPVVCIASKHYYVHTCTQNTH